MEWIGARLDRARLADLEARSDGGRRLNVAGEGGEYETLVVDAPFFRDRIAIDRAERTITGSTARLDISNAHLMRKEL